MTMKTFYAIILLTIATLFVGCAAKTTRPITLYTLRGDDAAATHYAHRFAGKTLRIMTPVSTKTIRTRKILYARMPQQCDAYAYSRWSDTPNHLIAAVLRSCLERSGIFKAVTDADSRADADLILESHLERFYQRFTAQGEAYAVIGLDFLLIDAHSRRVIATHSLRYRIPAPTPDAKGGVEAFEKGIRKSAEEVAQWLSKLP